MTLGVRLAQARASSPQLGAPTRPAPASTSAPEMEGASLCSSDDLSVSSRVRTSLAPARRSGPADGGPRLWPPSFSQIRRPRGRPPGPRGSLTRARLRGGRPPHGQGQRGPRRGVLPGGGGGRDLNNPRAIPVLALTGCRSPHVLLRDPGFRSVGFSFAVVPLSLRSAGSDGAQRGAEGLAWSAGAVPLEWASSATSEHPC